MLRLSSALSEVDPVYPMVLVPIFLLFMAILAYGWFYWQHTKARAAANSKGETAPAER